MRAELTFAVGRSSWVTALGYSPAAMADEALEILRPLKNWPGVARAHEARAKAYERMGDAEAARRATAERAGVCSSEGGPCP